MSDFIFSPGPVFSHLIYDYTCQTAKASIDTNVDGPYARLFPTEGALLEVFMSLACDEVAANSVIDMTVNNDTGANYDVTRNLSNSTSGGSVGTNLQTARSNWFFHVHGASGTTAYASALQLVIPDYSGTAFNKTGVMVGGLSDGTGGNQMAFEFLYGWRSTAAITRLKIIPETAGKNFVAGSRLLVYMR